MDIKQLKYLIALDRTRHFGQAAAACHITQPTLSMRIRNLEEELNLTLIFSKRKPFNFHYELYYVVRLVTYKRVQSHHVSRMWNFI